ncbi:DUF6355 family natural product biosynthesis protein [Actinokineospora sp. NPDC004072]
MKAFAVLVCLLTGLLAGPEASASPNMPCGWHATSPTAYYNHCGDTVITVVVEFWWKIGGTRTICVNPGITNLSAHPALQGGLITYAYYSGPGC